MAILLTGGLGYFGSHIASILKSKAVIIDNLSNTKLNYKNKLPSARVIIGELNYKNLNKIFNTYQIKGVIHLAGLKSVGQSMNEPLKYHRNNVISSLELLESMNKYNIKKLVFSSSATVYGSSNQSPFREIHYLESMNPYASNKIMIEQLIRDYAKSDDKFKAISLRYFNPLGSNVKKRLAEQPLGKPQNIMPTLVRAVKNNKKFIIYGNDYNTFDGTCIRDYIHVQDLADAHIIALKKLSKITGHESINLGMGKGLSVLQLIRIFEKANQVNVKLKFDKRRLGDIAISFADTKKSRKLLNWKPKFSYERMMKDSWQSFLINQDD